MTDDDGMRAIIAFEGAYRWLSNFYEDPDTDLYIPGRGIFRTAEHAYQSFKTEDPDWIERIRAAKTPRLAKRLGRKAPLIDGWEFVRERDMKTVLTCKFLVGTELAERLVNTGHKVLIEGNTWHDQYWGDCWCDTDRCKGVGQNRLGALLQERREVLQGVMG